ncbi:MAG: hypothetical protein ACYDDS_02790 [Candidatus Sulfotelmatobacter sp.]
MNKTIQLALLCVLAACAGTRALAQSRITANVPFDLISDRTFPAGRYAVFSFHDRLTVQDSTGKPVFIGIANQVSGRRVARKGMIVFRCYEAHCFLSELWTPTAENGSQLLPSRREAALARYGRGTEFALLAQP